MLTDSRDLENEIARLRQHLERIDRISLHHELERYRLSECRRLAELVLDATSRYVPLTTLEQALFGAKTFDFDLLDQAAQRLAELPLSKWDFTWKVGRKCEPKVEVATLKEVLTATRAVSEQSAELEVLLRLELAADRLFGTILEAIPPEHSAGQAATKWLVKQVTAKLGLLAEQQVMDLWGRLKREFEPSERRMPRMRPIAGVLEPAFLDVRNPAEAGARIAEYVCKLKPRLMRALDQEGQDSFPMNLFGVARLLAMTGGRLLTREDAALAACVTRIFILWEKAFRGKSEDLRAVVGLSASGRFSSGPQFEEALRVFLNGRSGASQWTLNARSVKAVFHHEASCLLDHLDSLKRRSADAEELLVRYKLAMEVAPDLANEEVGQVDELKLQRNLCRFLLEHGVKAVGTQFGRAQTDLVNREPHSAFVIEAKMVKGRPPTVREIRKWLGQLQAYMSQEPVKVDGALVIFNYTPCTIIATGVRIMDRYRIVPINLCDASPSKRVSSITILESQAGDVVEVATSNVTVAGRPRSRRRHAKTAGAADRQRARGSLKARDRSR